MTKKYDEFTIKDGSPYYIPGSNNPSTSLVVTLLTGPNYQTWVVEIQRTLSTKNKLGFINGSIKKPANEKDNYTISWIRCNDLVTT